jgi:hypothetical protein
MYNDKIKNKNNKNKNNENKRKVVLKNENR